MGKVVRLGNEFSDAAMVKELKEVSVKQDNYRRFNEDTWSAFHDKRMEVMRKSSTVAKEHGYCSEEYREAMLEENKYFKGGECYEVVQAEVDKVYNDLTEFHAHVKTKWGLQ